MTHSCGTMKKRLNKLLERPGNERCAECDRKHNRPTWVSFFTCPVDCRKLAVLVCPHCHHLHKRVAEGEFVIKGLSEVDDFTEDDLAALELSGNQLVNACYEAGVTNEKDGRDCRKYGYEAFFFEKFVNLRFFSADLYKQLMNESSRSHLGLQSNSDNALESVARLPIETMNIKEEEKEECGEDMTREDIEEAKKEHEEGGRPDNNESVTFSDESSSNEASTKSRRKDKSREKSDKHRDNTHRSSSSARDRRRSSKDHHKSRSSSKHGNRHDEHKSCKRDSLERTHPHSTSSRSLKREDNHAEESRRHKRSSSSNKHKSSERDCLERTHSYRKVKSLISSKKEQANDSDSPMRISSSSRKANDRKSLGRKLSLERLSNSSKRDLMEDTSDDNPHKRSSSSHRARTPKHEGSEKISRTISSSSSKRDLALDNDSSDEDRKHTDQEDHTRSHSHQQTSSNDHLHKYGRKKSSEGANSHAERKKAMLKDGRRSDVSPSRAKRSCSTDGSFRLLRKASQKDELDRPSSHEKRRPASKSSFSPRKLGSGERSFSLRRDLLQQSKSSSRSLCSVLVKASSTHDLAGFRVRSASCLDLALSDDSDLGGQHSARIMQMYSRRTEHPDPSLTPFHGSFSSIHNNATACMVLDRRAFLSKAASERSMSNQEERHTLCRRAGSARDLLDSRRAETLGVSWDEDAPGRVSSKDGDLRYRECLREENANDHHVSKSGVTSNQQGGLPTRRIQPAQAGAFSTPTSRRRLHGSYNSLRQRQNRQIALAAVPTQPQLAFPRQGSIDSLMMDDTPESAQPKIQLGNYHRSLSEHFLGLPSKPDHASCEGSSTGKSITTSPGGSVRNFPEGSEKLDIDCDSDYRECLDRKD